ncbi:MAG TPA: hypothetical protein VGB73_19335 [Pyrinomonadaceae bacterium]|jgi:hypothetical protein
MTQRKKATEPKRRTRVQDLPKEEKTLSQDEQKRVKGGDFTDALDLDARGVAVGKGIRVRGG